MEIKKAAMINALGKYSKVIISIVVNAILARILSAEDYGIVAIITVFSALFAALSDMGFGSAIIQNKDLSSKDVNNIFSLTVFISLALGILFFILSFFIAWFYKDDIYIPLGAILSVSVFFNSLNMVPNGLLNREKKFYVIAYRTICVYSFSALITVFLALRGFRFYALAIESVLSSVLTFLWNIKSSSISFSFQINRDSIQKVSSYSGYQFAFNLVNYFSRNLDNLLIGKVIGSVELGYYNKAYTLMLYPVNNLAGVISPVLHPLLSDYQNNKRVIYDKFCLLSRMLMCLSLYITFVCFAAAAEIINVMYGPNWNKSIECFQTLSIAIVPQMINASMGAIFQSIGNTKLLFINSCINTVLTIVGIVLGFISKGGIISIARYVSISYIFHFFTAAYMLVTYGFKYSFIDYIKLFGKEILVFGGMIIAFIFYPFSFENKLASLLLKIMYYLFAFIILLVFTGEYKLFKDILLKNKKGKARLI